jgi:hypothetical protein
MYSIPFYNQGGREERGKRNENIEEVDMFCLN